MLEYWNDGIMGFGQMEYWDIDNVPLDSEVDKEVSFPIVSTFHHSSIALFHVRGINSKPQKIHLISISCRISETFNYGQGILQ